MWAREAAAGCTITVRVTPRAAKPGVDVGPAGVIVRVASPPAGGRATEEAAGRLARALGVAPSRVSLRRGARSREKVFEVTGMRPEAARAQLSPRG